MHVTRCVHAGSRANRIFLGLLRVKDRGWADITVPSPAFPVGVVSGAVPAPEDVSGAGLPPAAHPAAGLEAHGPAA